MRLQIGLVTGMRLEVELDEGREVTLDRVRLAVARAAGLLEQRLKLVKQGQPVDSDAAAQQLRDRDTLLALAAPKPPPQKLRDMADGGAEEEDAELLRLRLPATAPRWQRWLAGVLLSRARLPEWVVAALFSLGWHWWLGLLAWVAGAKLSARWDLGPVFVVTSIFALILLNLGKRREGEASAYSVFNQGRRLPGQLTAEDLDAQLRRGHLG